jgi:hypothetical protein
MTIAAHENKFVKNCLNCKHEITDLKEDHLFCTDCGFPIRNECTGTSNFCDGYSNGPLLHNFEEDEYILNPEDAFCPKCGTESLFNKRGLINVKHPKVDIIQPISNINVDDFPF